MSTPNHSDIFHLATLHENPDPIQVGAENKAPRPGTKEELDQFIFLQKRLEHQYRSTFLNPRQPRTVLVVPSLTMDAEELRKISGVHYYEERLLCLLMLLRLPKTKLIYVTSKPIAPSIIDYYLHLIPGIPEIHARKRLTLLNCYDASPIPLTQKILQRPRLMQRILDISTQDSACHIACFNATPLERTLSVRLGIPLYACDPELNGLGSKSGSREIFKKAGVPVANGYEHLHDESEIVDALALLKMENPKLERAVVKLNEGFSGEGNAIFSYKTCSQYQYSSLIGLKRSIKQQLSRGLKFEAEHETYERYLGSYASMGGIVEEFIEGRVKTSPSVQCRINPVGEASIISTHDQVLGGASGQVFLGCTFPAEEEYRVDLQLATQKINAVMRDEGVLGRYGVDYISVKEGNMWKHYAVEINLRKGGTTHPYLMLQLLTDGRYDEETGLYRIPTGQYRYYYASDNFVSPTYQGLTPDDLIDIAVNNGLHFHGTTQEGVVFHLIGALSEYGKLGVLCVGASRARALEFYKKTVHVMDHACGK